MFMIINWQKKVIYYLIISLILSMVLVYFLKFPSIPSSTEDMIFKVVIDPGHGSIDTGTYYKDLYEKDINLSLARFLAEEFKMVNIIPIMTRTEDVLYKNDRNIDLRNRPEIARKHKADLYISIHVNNFPTQNPQGSQIFYKPESKKSKLLAQIITEKLTAINQSNNREIISGDFYVLNKTPCPAVLIEAGFLSNQEDRKKLTDSNYQKKFAQAIKNGTVEYLRREISNMELESENINTKTEGKYSYLKVHYLNENNLNLVEHNFVYPAGAYLQGSFHKYNNIEIKAKALFTQLLSSPTDCIPLIPSSAEILDIDFSEQTLTLNFNADLKKNFQGGAGLELLAIKALKKTFFSIPEVKELVILIEDEKMQTIGSHIILTKFKK